MKKIAFSLLFVMLALSIKGAISEKDIVYLDNFTYTNTISKNYVEALRNRITEGIVSVDRVIVKDINTAPALKKTKAKDNVDEATLTKLQKLNAHYLIQGHVATMEASKSTKSDGTIKYTGAITFTLKIVEVSNGALVATETYKYPSGLISFSTTGDTESEAIENTMKPIGDDMVKLVDINFQLTGKILQVSKEDKGKVQEVYISLGSKDGIQKGQKFEVTVQRNIAGRIAASKVGEIQAEAVEATDLTRCKVNGKAQEAIKEAMDKGEVISVSSIAKSKNILGEGKKIFGL